MTNEEWLIALSTDKKAEFIAQIVPHCFYCPCKCENKVRGRNKCPKAIKEWLKRERDV